MNSPALSEDITRLITGYLTKPTHEPGEWVRKIPGFTWLDSKLSKPQAEHLLCNPRAVIPANWKKVYPVVSQVLRPDEIIRELARNHTTRAIKLIMDMDNWLDLIVSMEYTNNESSILIILLRNPHATPIIDALFHARPDAFKRYVFSRNIASSQSAENIINLSFQYGIYLETSELIMNPSNKIYENTIGKFAPDVLENHLINLLQNPNLPALKLAIPYLSRYLLNQFNYGAMGTRAQKRLDAIICSLIKNPSPYAAEILEKIIDNSEKSHDGSIHIGLLSCIFNEPKTYENPSDLICSLIKKYASSPAVYSAFVSGMWSGLAKNTNPNMINFLVNYLPRLMKDYRFYLGSNPAAREFIELHPEMFSDVPQIYANPESFVPVINTRLVRLVEPLIFL